VIALTGWLRRSAVPLLLLVSRMAFGLLQLVPGGPRGLPVEPGRAARGSERQ
jgi:hypothetical protein